MISRRLVRIKAMQTHYAFLQNSGGISSEEVWKELQRNIEKSHELYVYLHCLIIALADFAGEKIEIAKHKHISTFEDLNPNTRFVDNKIIAAFRNNPKISNLFSNNDYNWEEYPDFIKNSWNQISKSPYYIDYMKSETCGLKEDIKIIIKIINKTFTSSPRLDEILEEKSIYWNDDLEFLLSNIIQNIKKLNEPKEEYDDDETIKYRLQPLFKNTADEKFARDLITKTNIHATEYDNIILETLKKWELERIAFTDRILLHLALCEMNEFPEMPVKVTINEYLDIAKFYSTEKSSIFINGILDKIYVQLKTTNKLNKKGLGLVE